MKIEKYVTVFEALAQASRLKIFRLLVKAGGNGICPCVLAERLKMPRNTLSFHLALLTQAGLCRAERKGKNLFYRAQCGAVSAAAEFLLKDCCGCNRPKEKQNV